MAAALGRFKIALMVFSSCVILLLILQVSLGALESCCEQILMSTTSSAGRLCMGKLCVPGWLALGKGEMCRNPDASHLVWCMVTQRCGS